MTFLFRFFVWLCIACLLCWPIPIYLDSLLIGNPDIDVWNHAWGYWYVAQAFEQGKMPLETNLVGAPNGGLLYYIDMMGQQHYEALMSCPSRRSRTVYL